MATFYEYRHHAGYGRDDHMADEIIARAARQLGLDTGNRIAQCAGFASHAVPMSGATVRLSSGPGVRRKMERALRLARKELRFRADLMIGVVLVRERQATDLDGYSHPTMLREERNKHGKWIVIDTRST